jgi:hypothetical protein
MQKEIRSWAVWSGLLGLLNLLTSGLNSAWGATLILVGLASLVFQAPAMFILYGISLAWVAINNLLSSQMQWIFFALLQLFLAFQVLRTFFRFRPVLQFYQSQPPDGSGLKPGTGLVRSAKLFPWLGFLLSGTALFVFVVCFLVGIILYDTPGLVPYKPALYFTEELMVNFGMIGLALGIGSLLSKYRYKILSILAILSGAVLMGVLLLLILLARMG